MGRHKQDPASLPGERGAGKFVQAGRLNDPENTGAAAETQGGLPIVDRFGKQHGEEVLTAWSAGAIRAMGLRRLDGRPL